jgi:hypothetical protein
VIQSGYRINTYNIVAAVNIQSEAGVSETVFLIIPAPGTPVGIYGYGGRIPKL